MNSVFNITKVLLGYVIISISIFLMMRLALIYTSFESDVAFLALKQDYIRNTVWLTSFYIHVFSSALCLFAGLTQFSPTLLKQSPKLHRVVGRVYVYNILVINFPAAMIMAVYANGFLPSKTAFIILDLLWFWFTLKAVIEIRKGNVLQHKYYMIRSFALTFSAITLRTWNLILTNYTSLAPMDIYMMNAWLGFVPNWIIAEIIIFKLKANISLRHD